MNPDPLTPQQPPQPPQPQPPIPPSPTPGPVPPPAPQPAPIAPVQPQVMQPPVQPQPAAPQMPAGNVFDAGLPPQPKSGGKKKWIAIVGGIIAFIVMFVIVGFLLKPKSSPKQSTSNQSSNNSAAPSTSSFSGTSPAPAAKPADQNYTSADGGFSAWFPASPTIANQTVTVTDKIQAPSTLWTVTNKGADSYAVAKTTLPNNSGVTLDTIYNNDKSAGQVSAITKTTVSGLPAYSYTGSITRQSQTVYVNFLTVIKGNNVYELLYGNVQANSPNGPKFISNFTLQ